MVNIPRLNAKILCYDTCQQPARYFAGTVEALRRLKCLTTQIRVSQITIVNVQTGKSMLAQVFLVKLF